MPLPLETTPVGVNTIYFPQISVNTNIVTGQLVTSCVIIFQGANVTEDGVWTSCGIRKTFVIRDISKLEESLSELQEAADSVCVGLITLIGQINAIKKVM